jgi:RNA polymerase sigma factor (sigma-70 family)
VAQEVMGAVAQAIRKFDYDPQRGKFRNWLLTVVRSKLNNFLVNQQRQPLTADTSLLRTLEDRTTASEETQWDRVYRERIFDWAAEKVRAEVQDPTWQAFWQSAIEDQPGGEVAKRLGLSLSSVYAARSRVLARLKEIIAQVDGDDLVLAETTK